MTTQHHRADLAVRPIERRGHPRIADRRRLVAFAELFTDAPRKPDAVYALQRKEPRVKLYDERHRSVIHQSIARGEISRERIARYRLAQLLDDLAQFPDAAQVSIPHALHMLVAKETAEMVHAQTIALALPTPANRDGAVRETRDVVAMGYLVCAALEQDSFTGPVS